MLKIFKDKNYEATNFSPFIYYLNILEESGYNTMSYLSEKDSDKIVLTYDNEKIEILGKKTREYEWICIYKFNANNEKYEQIEFMIYLPSSNTLEKHNRIIKYAAHLEDELYSRLVWSSFYYKDNEYLKGKRELRKITVEDLSKIFYSKTMNLSELVTLADSKIFEFYEIKTLIGEEVKELILEY